MAKIKIRRGLEANLVAGTLIDGEIGFTTDTKKIYIGFGGIGYQVGGASALGDMLKSIYDTDNDGIVDWAENVNWSGVQGKPGTFMPPVATASVLGGIKIGSNLSATPDGVLSGNSIPESFIPKSERFTITGGQTTFDLVKGYYTPGSLNWTIYGYQQSKESITEVTSTSFSIPTGLPDGTEFEVQYIQTVNLVPFPYHKTEHLPGGVDDLGLNAVALSGSYADLSGKPVIPTTLPANGGNADTVRVMDTRSTNFNGFDYKGLTVHLKSNTADGLSDGGTYHGVLHITQWNDISGGRAHQFGFTDNGNIQYRDWNGSWSPWTKIAKVSDIPTKTSQITNDSGYITSAGSGAKIATDPVAPTSPAAGDFWYKVI